MMTTEHVADAQPQASPPGSKRTKKQSMKDLREHRRKLREDPTYGSPAQKEEERAQHSNEKRRKQDSNRRNNPKRQRRRRAGARRGQHGVGPRDGSSGRGA